MAITVDPATEQRIERQIYRGAFRDPGELLAHGLDLIEAEAVEQDWPVRNKEAINARLKESFAEAARGEGYPLEEVDEMVAQRHSSRAA